MRLLWLWLAALAVAKPAKTDADEDPVALAGLLVREGDWDRAGTTLGAVEPTTPGLDVARYWTLRGLVELHEQRPADAASSFEAALAVAKEGRELLEMHLARARLATSEPELALEALQRTGTLGDGLPGKFLRARSRRVGTVRAIQDCWGSTIVMAPPVDAAWRA